MVNKTNLKWNFQFSHQLFIQSDQCENDSIGSRIKEGHITVQPLCKSIVSMLSTNSTLCFSISAAFLLWTFLDISIEMPNSVTFTSFKDRGFKSGSIARVLAI